jgi:CheY-like chemotaxis protein
MVGSGAEALDLLQAPELLTSCCRTVMMPGMSGTDLIARAKEVVARRYRRGDDGLQYQSTQTVNACAVGAHRLIITKPFNIFDLREAVAHAVRGEADALERTARRTAAPPASWCRSSRSARTRWWRMSTIRSAGGH